MPILRQIFCFFSPRLIAIDRGGRPPGGDQPGGMVSAPAPPSLDLTGCRNRPRYSATSTRNIPRLLTTLGIVFPSSTILPLGPDTRGLVPCVPARPSPFLHGSNSTKHAQRREVAALPCPSQKPHPANLAAHFPHLTNPGHPVEPENGIGLNYLDAPSEVRTTALLGLPRKVVKTDPLGKPKLEGRWSNPAAFLFGLGTVRAEEPRRRTLPPLPTPWRAQAAFGQGGRRCRPLVP